MRFILTLLMVLSWTTAGWGMSLADVEMAVMKQDYPQAEELARQYLETSPEDGDRQQAMYLLAVSRLRSGDGPSPVRLFKDLLKEDISKDMRDKASIGLFDCYYSQGKYKKASKTIDEILGFGARSNYLSLIYLKAARVNLKLSRWKEAKQYLQRIIDRFPESFEYHTARQLLEEEQYFAVQVGAFVERERALQVVDALQYQDHYAYIVETLDRDQRKFYRVRVGQLTVLKKAERLRKELSQLGYPTRIYP